MRLRHLFCAIPSAAVLGIVPAWAGHKDVKPVADEIVQRLVRDHAPSGEALTFLLDRQLQDAQKLLADVENSDKYQGLSDTQRFAAKKTFLEAKRNEMSMLRKAVVERLARGRANLQSRGAQPAQLTQWDSLTSAVNDRFGRVAGALESIEKGKNRGERRSALTRAKSLIDGVSGGTRVRELMPRIPVQGWRTTEPVKPKVQTKASRHPAYMLPQRAEGRDLYAFNGDMLFLAALPDPTPGEATVCSYTSADLQATEDAPLNPEIRALAEQLGYDATQIFQFVSNEIEFQPYYGSLKGAMGALYGKSGGPTDQASLLIALLRASNIPARYVKGLVQLNDGTPQGQNGRAPMWLGVKTYDAAVKVLQLGANPAVTTVTNGASQVQGVAFVHVWVEACVPYGQYRGGRIDNSGHRWVPLDPSIKDKSYQAGITASVVFDYSSFLASRTNQLPQEKYEDQVESQIKGVAPNFGNNTLADVGYLGQTLKREVDILPAGTPYDVASFLAWGDGNTTAEAAALPDAHRYKLGIVVKNTSAAQIFSTTLSMPEMALKRATLSFKGSTTTDQNTLDAWRSQSLSTPLPCSPVVNVVPSIKVEGTERAAGTTAIDFCSINNGLDLTLTLAELTNPVNSASYTNINAADYHALLAYAYHASDRLLEERAARLLASVRATSNPNSNLEETQGELLHLVGLKYLRYIDDGMKRVAELSGETGTSGTHLGIISSRTKVEYLFDLPFAVNRSNFVIDFAGVRWSSVDVSTALPKWETFKLAAHVASNYESYIWQESLKLDAVSTVRGIQFAREKGIEVLTLTSSTWNVSGDTTCANPSSQCYKFTHNADTSLNFTTGEVNKLKTDWIDLGYTLTIPRSKIKYPDANPGNWFGAVYIAENQAPTTFKATFAISGGYSGGYSLGLQIPYSYDLGLDSGYNYLIPPTAASLGLQAFVTDAINWGYSSRVTYGGDPVNLVTGNMYHSERDISIKGRGGFPVVFERSYNSRKPLDGPLGYGWTHSFNHFLSFRDDNANGATDAGDTDGLTSTIAWVDGSGAEKLIRVTGIGGGVPVGSFAAPQGFFFQTTKNANGTYTVREKNGLSYAFETTAGTVGQKAKLTQIADRNGNTLTLAYSGVNLSTVTDGLSRSLTFSYLGSRVSEITDWTGRKFQYQYDVNGNLSAFKNPLAVAGSQSPVTYLYYTALDGGNIDHAMKDYKLPRGNGMHFDYYMNGRAFRHIDSLGNSTTFTYNDFRRETVQVNARGGERHFFFDPFGNPARIVEENGGERLYTYDSASPYNRLSEKTPLGYTTQYQYDANGNVTQITLPSGNTIVNSNFNAFASPGKAKDPRGNYTLHKFDVKGNVLQQIKLRNGVGSSVDPTTYTPVAADTRAWQISTYDAVGNVLTAKRIRDFATQVGPSIEYTYDAQNLNATTIARRGDKDGNGALDTPDVANLTYDALGRVKTGIDADWHPTQYDYDDVDRIIRGTDRVGKIRDYKYDSNGNPSEQRLVQPVAGVNTLIDSTSARYDLADRKEVSLDAAGNATRYRYDPSGNVLGITNPDNYLLSFDYDQGDHVIKAYDQRGNAVTRTLDLDGKVRTVTDPNGNMVTYDYYAAPAATGSIPKDGRLKRVTQPKIQSFTQGRAVEYDYDENGNVVKQTEFPADGSASRIILTTYDELNRPTRIVGPVFTDATFGSIRPVTRYTYDNLGNVLTVAAGRTDSTGTNTGSDNVAAQMTYVFDDFGRKLKQTDPLGKFRTWIYDINGNVLTQTDAKGQVTSFTWDYGHQLLTRVNPAGNVTYTRNSLGQVTTAATLKPDSSPLVTHTYQYDTAHRVKSVTDSRGSKTLAYTYSPGGLLNNLADSEGNGVAYQYDPVGRLSYVAATDYTSVTFAYDPGGRLTEKWMSNGTNAQYRYNADNSIATIFNQSVAGVPGGGSSSIFTDHHYTYDGFGNRSNANATIGPVVWNWRYVYDNLNRLAEDYLDQGSGESLWLRYRYDVLGNLQRETDVTGAYTAYTFDAANQLVTSAGFNASNVQVSPTLTLGYDDNGSVTSRTGNGVIHTFTWDALNRLSQQTRTGSGAYSESYAYDDAGRRLSKIVAGATTQYLYQGDAIYAEYGASWTAASAFYTHGPAIDTPLIRHSTGGPRFYHQDALGSVVALSNPSGLMEANGLYASWGDDFGPNFGSPQLPAYGYTGRESDSALRLSYYRNRYYWPGFRRFISRDPIGLAGGINPYVYVNNNPVNFNDPLGLTPSLLLFADNSYYGTMNDAAPIGASMMTSATQNLGSIKASPPNFFVDNFFGQAVNSMVGGPLTTLFGGEHNVNPLTGYMENRPSVDQAMDFLALGGGEALLGLKGLGAGAIGLRSFLSDSFGSAAKGTTTALSEIRYTQVGEEFIRYESANPAFSRITSTGGVTPGTYAAPASDGLVPIGQRIPAYNLPSSNIPRPNAVVLHPPAGTPVIGPRSVAGGTGNEVIFPFGY